MLPHHFLPDNWPVAHMVDTSRSINLSQSRPGHTRALPDLRMIWTQVHFTRIGTCLLPLGPRAPAAGVAAQGERPEGPVNAPHDTVGRLSDSR